MAHRPLEVFYHCAPLRWLICGPLGGRVGGRRGGLISARTADRRATACRCPERPRSPFVLPPLCPDTISGRGARPATPASNHPPRSRCAALDRVRMEDYPCTISSRLT
ncbi:unnamed protein product, partial [Iphiclides podalirius]